MEGALRDLIDRWGACRPGQDRRDLTEDIAVCCRPIADRAARSRGLNGQDADDVAQQSCTKFLAYLEGGGRVNENPEALVWRIAERVAVDLHRQRQRTESRDRRLLAEETARNEATEDPRVFWESAESQLRAKALVRKALGVAPENYRVAIQRVYFDGDHVEDIAEEYYRAKVDAGEVDGSSEAAIARARKQARNKIDQQLKRGRDWLRRRLLEAVMTDDGESN